MQFMKYLFAKEGKELNVQNIAIYTVYAGSSFVEEQKFFSCDQAFTVIWNFIL